MKTDDLAAQPLRGGRDGVSGETRPAVGLVNRGRVMAAASAAALALAALAAPGGDE